jgi:hypothetical protein
MIRLLGCIVFSHSIQFNANLFSSSDFSTSMPVGHALGIATNAALDAGSQGRPVSG